MTAVKRSNGASTFVGASGAHMRARLDASDWIERTYRARIEHQRVMDAIDELCALDDDDLREIGLVRDDLTVDRLNASDERRSAAFVSIGRWD